ncbi:MAG: hypothetical protein MZV70_03630 [Desulfobacterales bacterium]|nr:hypothetical protein [Desulfobacterales bacterium]
MAWIPRCTTDLKTLRTELPRLAELLKLEAGAELASWCKAVDARLLAPLRPRLPAGGRDLRRRLVGQVHPLQLAARRPVRAHRRAGGHEPARAVRRPASGWPERPRSSPRLVEPFGAAGRAAATARRTCCSPAAAALRPAPARARSTLILMDTPDFDTGARGRYANRRSAQGALEAADLLIYVFTNSNYNNRDNTDFIARMLTGIGRRKCFLVYRCYPSFTRRGGGASTP